MKVNKLGDRYYKTEDAKLRILNELKDLAKSEFESKLVGILQQSNISIIETVLMPENYEPLMFTGIVHH
jgi:hypothetical protein